MCGDVVFEIGKLVVHRLLLFRRFGASCGEKLRTLARSLSFLGVGEISVLIFSTVSRRREFSFKVLKEIKNEKQWRPSKTTAYKMFLIVLR